MDPIIGGALIGAGSGIAGAFMGKRSSDRANAANMAMQREFAQNGIRWRVRDAKKAGIHPLYALGANVTTATPSSVGDTLGQDLGRVGQDIGRAVSATATPNERELGALRIQAARLDVEGKSIDNQIRAKELRQTDQVGPPFPGSPLPMPGAPDQSQGLIPGTNWYRTASGIMPYMNRELSEGLESSALGRTFWNTRHYLHPTMGIGSKPSKSFLPSGFVDWKWSSFLGEWQPSRSVVSPNRLDRFVEHPVTRGVANQLRRFYRHGLLPGDPE